MSTAEAKYFSIQCSVFHRTLAELEITLAREKLKVLFSLMELGIAEIRYGKVLLAHPSFFLPVEDYSLQRIF